MIVAFLYNLHVLINVSISLGMVILQYLSNVSVSDNLFFMKNGTNFLFLDVFVVCGYCLSGSYTSSCRCIGIFMQCFSI